MVPKLGQALVLIISLASGQAAARDMGNPQAVQVARSFLDAIDRRDAGATSAFLAPQMKNPGTLSMLIGKRSYGAVWSGGNGGRSVRDVQTLGGGNYLVHIQSRYENATINQDVSVSCAGPCLVTGLRESPG